MKLRQKGWGWSQTPRDDSSAGPGRHCLGTNPQWVLSFETGSAGYGNHSLPHLILDSFTSDPAAQSLPPLCPQVRVDKLLMGLSL